MGPAEDDRISKSLNSKIVTTDLHGFNRRERRKVASSPACSGATPFWEHRRGPVGDGIQNKKCEPWFTLLFSVSCPRRDDTYLHQNIIPHLSHPSTMGANFPAMSAARNAASAPVTTSSGK